MVGTPVTPLGLTCRGSLAYGLDRWYMLNVNLFWQISSALRIATARGFSMVCEVLKEAGDS